MNMSKHSDMKNEALSSVITNKIQRKNQMKCIVDNGFLIFRFENIGSAEGKGKVWRKTGYKRRTKTCI